MVERKIEELDISPSYRGSNRLISIDALRGLAMFFIIGGEHVFTSFSKVWPTSLIQ